MITKEIAMQLHVGQTLYHIKLVGCDKRPLRCRVNGKCKTWKKTPHAFRLPVKHGLKHCFYIFDYDGADWRTTEYEESK